MWEGRGGKAGVWEGRVGGQECGRMVWESRGVGGQGVGG